MSTLRALLKPAVWVFYIVVGLEFLFMISPFALYFYSSYGDVLNVFHRWPATAWLTGFFLPHISITTSPFLDSLKLWGFRLAGMGLLVFLLGAVQIYGSKLLRRREVTGGLYRISRHPQYLALALTGFGVLLIWPRFLVLICFVTMLFLYLLLARWEEQRCLERYGDSYRAYMRRVGFLGPGWLTSWIPSPSGWAKRPAVMLAAYLVVLTTALAAAIGLRELSLSSISSFYVDDTAVLSPAILDREELERAHRLAIDDPEVRTRLDEFSSTGGWLVYVVPVDWHLPDLPLEAREEIPAEHRGGHTTPRDFEPGLYKVLFARTKTHHPESRGRDIVRTAYGRQPVLRVRLDTLRGRVEAVESPPATVVWGDIPTPLY